jgi:hypothetical protein
MINRGRSLKDAVVINAEYTQEGIEFEYKWIERVWGGDWTLIRQEVFHDEGKDFDILHIEFPDKSVKEIYFDISNFFGKHKFPL